jgi:hypothetical protein
LIPQPLDLVRGQPRGLPQLFHVPRRAANAGAHLARRLPGKAHALGQLARAFGHLVGNLRFHFLDARASFQGVEFELFGVGQLAGRNQLLPVA